MTTLGVEGGLRRLMRPASVAVVGATDRADSYAAETLLNIETIGFAGRVWGVNPRRSEVMGRECVPSLSDLPEPVDAVVVAIPAAAVAAVVDEAGARGCGGAVVFGAGFGEVAAGADHHADLVAAAARHALPVCGPNCNGIVSPWWRTALWGDSLSVTEPGPVALVSQSGNVAVNALATRRGLRFHTVVASGNQAVLSAADYLEYLAGEDGVGAVALYLEDDGGPRLLDGLAACAEADVPVVVLKVGRSATGARAAAAHSGALAGDQRVFRAVVEEAGAVWAEDVHELLELAKAIGVSRTGARATRGRARSERPGLAIMTCSGGDSAQGADEADRLGVALPALAEPTRARLTELLPAAATVANPLDYTALIWGDVSALGALVRVLGEDPGVDQVLVFYDQPHGMTGASAESWRAVREGVTLGAALSPVPTLVASTLPELLDDAAAGELHGAGVPTAAGLRTGLRCAAALLSGRSGPRPDASVDADRAREIAAAARAGAPRGPGPWLAEHAAKDLLRAAGLAVPAGRLVAGPDDAVRAWRELGGGRLVVKLSAAGVQHKSELGAVRVGLDSEAGIREAAAAMAHLAEAHGGSVLVERMVAGDVELLMAAHRDGVVPALIVGLGGVWTELLDDVAVVPLPADRRRMERAIGRLRGAPLLRGGRGRPMLDVPAAAALAARLGDVLLEQRLWTLECNPVLVAETGAIPVDAAIQGGSDV